MNNPLLCAALFFFCLTAAHTFGNADTAKPDEPRLVEVTGVVRLVGSGLFNDIVITGEDAQWYVDSEEMYKLHDLQQRIVTIEAEETIVELRFANGQSAGKRRVLSKVRVLRVE